MDIPVSLIILVFLLLGGMVLYVARLMSRINFLKKKVRDVLRQRAEINNFLTLFSKSLKSVEEINDSMNMTARYISDLVEACSICIFTVEGEYLKASGVCGAFPLPRNANKYALTKPKYIFETLRRMKLRIGEGMIGKIAADREPLYLEDASVDRRISEFSAPTSIHTLMAVPMVRDAELHGVICAVNNRNADLPFTPEQFWRLKFIASQVILAQDLVKVYSNLSEQQRINQELEFARQLQASLLPRAFPSWAQFAVHSITRSSKEVNGDFYDFVEIDQDRLLIVVGDACGKGVPACMLTAMTRSFIRSGIEHFTTLEDMLRELNHNLYRDTDDERFVTLGCCLLDKKRSLIEYSRAGHTELITFVRGHIRKIFPKGSALGLLPNELSEFETFCFEFDPDMSLLLFTDGISEAFNEAYEEYGVERLQKVFEKSRQQNDPPQVTIEKILHSVDYFTGLSKHHDDQTLVLIQHL